MAKVISKAPDADAQGRAPKGVSKKRYAKVETAYQETLDEYNLYKEYRETLSEIIKAKAITVKPNSKGGKEKTTDLTPHQLAGYRNRLTETNAKLQMLKDKLRTTGKVYQSTAQKNTSATKVKMVGKMERKRQALAAERNIENIKKHVAELMKKLSAKKDQDYINLRELALDDGRQFHLNFMKLLRRVLTDKKIKLMINCSPKTHGVLSRMVRESLGYVRKK